MRIWSKNNKDSSSGMGHWSRLRGKTRGGSYICGMTPQEAKKYVLSMSPYERIELLIRLLTQANDVPNFESEGKE